MRKHSTLIHALAIAAGLFLAASPVHGDLIDPVGDTFPGSLGTKPDVTGIEAQVDAKGMVFFSVTFAGPISAPSSFVGPFAPAPSVVGTIAMDTDMNPATGSFLLNPFIGPPPLALGSEFHLNIASEALHPGMVDLVNSITNALVAEIPISFTATGFSLLLSRALIGGVEEFNYGAVFGNFINPTDRAPNGQNPGTSVVVPEPAALALFGLGMAALALAGSRRRKT